MLSSCLNLLQSTPIIFVHPPLLISSLHSFHLWPLTLVQIFYHCSHSWFKQNFFPQPLFFLFVSLQLPFVPDLVPLPLPIPALPFSHLSHLAHFSILLCHPCPCVHEQLSYFSLDSMISSSQWFHIFPLIWMSCHSLQFSVIYHSLLCHFSLPHCLLCLAMVPYDPWCLAHYNFPLLQSLPRLLAHYCYSMKWAHVPPIFWWWFNYKVLTKKYI